MLNLVEAVRTNPRINRLEIGDFLFAEFTCGIADEKAALWAHHDYLVHVLTGKKTWHTTEGVFAANPGDSLFFKKGAAIVEQHLEVDFCLLMFFIPDEWVRATVRDIGRRLRPARTSAASINRGPGRDDTALSAFFASLAHLLRWKEMPPNRCCA